MNCLFLRRAEKLEFNPFSMSVTGNLSSNYAYFVIDDTKYNSTGTYNITPISEVVVYAYSGNYYTQGAIILNGTTVASSIIKLETLSYKIPLTGRTTSVSLKFSGSANYGYKCEIMVS